MQRKDSGLCTLVLKVGACAGALVGSYLLVKKYRKRRKVIGEFENVHVKRAPVATPDSEESFEKSIKDFSNIFDDELTQMRFLKAHEGLREVAGQLKDEVLINEIASSALSLLMTAWDLETDFSAMRFQQFDITAEALHRAIQKTDKELGIMGHRMAISHAETYVELMSQPFEELRYEKEDCSMAN